MHAQGGRLGDREWFRWLQAQLSELRPRVLVLDPFASMFDGNENETGDVNSATRTLDDLCRPFPDLLLVLLHHTSKAGATGATAGMHAARGSSVLSAWCDAQLNVSERKGAGRAVRFRVEVSKMREAERGPPAAFAIDVESGEVGIEQAEPRTDELDAAIVAFLSDATEPPSGTAIRDAIHKKKDAVLKTLAAMERSGRIAKRGKGYVLVSGGATP